jgi:hypothetical protein
MTPHLLSKKKVPFWVKKYSLAFLFFNLSLLLVVGVIFLDDKIQNIKYSKYRIELITRFNNPNLSAKDTILKVFAPYFSDDDMGKLETLLSAFSESAINFIEFILKSKEMNYEELALIRDILLKVLHSEKLTQQVIHIAKNFNNNKGNNLAVVIKIAKVINAQEMIPSSNIETVSMTDMITFQDIKMIAYSNPVISNNQALSNPVISNNQALSNQMKVLLSKIQDKKYLYDKFRKMENRLPPMYKKQLVTMLYNLPPFELSRMILMLDKLDTQYTRGTIDLIHNRNLKDKKDYVRAMLLINDRSLLKSFLVIGKKLPNLRAYLSIILKIDRKSVPHLLNIMIIYDKNDMNKLLIALSHTRRTNEILDTMSGLGNSHLKKMISIINERDVQYISYAEALVIGLRKRLLKNSVISAVRSGIDIGVRVGDYDRIKASMGSLLYEREHTQARILKETNNGHYSGHSVTVMTNIMNNLDKHNANKFADILSGSKGFTLKAERGNTRHITDETKQFRIRQYTDIEEKDRLQERIDFIKETSIIVPHEDL